MLIATGVDLIEISRIQSTLDRYGDRFLERIYTEREIALTGRKPAELAVRFAAKEAASKALGTGIGLISWRDMEITPDPLGKPVLTLTNRAADRAQALGLTGWSVSLSHSRGMAVAVVVGYGAGKSGDQ
jgi:holo-[acyl-carrier protein] synthase